MGAMYVVCVKLNNDSLGANQEVRNHFGQGAPRDEGDGEYAMDANQKLLARLNFKPWEWDLSYNIKYPGYIILDTDMKISGDMRPQLKALINEALEFGTVMVEGDGLITFVEKAACHMDSNPGKLISDKLE